MIWSYSFLDTLNTCPRQAYHKYAVKDLPYVESDAQKWGNLVHSAMEKRLRDKTPLPEQCAAFENYAQAVEAMPGIKFYEDKVGIDRNGDLCDFFAKTVYGRGKVDVQIVMEDGLGFILDWKTGKVKEDPRELEINAVLLTARWPAVRRWKGAYVWFKEGRIGPAHDLDPEKASAEIARTMQVVDFLEKEGTPWPVRPNGLCKQWCAVASCPHHGGR